MIKKLLAATSVAALIVGGASAQLALKQDSTGAGITAPYVLASEFGAGITGAVVNAGGTVGATSVRYLLTTDGVDGSLGGGVFTGKDGVSLNLPVRASSCGDVTFSVTEFQTETAGTPIEGGTASLTDFTAPVAKVTPAVTCVSAFDASLVLDAANTALALDPGAPCRHCFCCGYPRTRFPSRHRSG